MDKLKNLELIANEITKSKIGREILTSLRKEKEIDILAIENIRPMITAILSLNTESTTLYLTNSPSKIYRIADDIKSFLSSTGVLVFPDWEILPAESLSPDIEIIGKRAVALDSLKNKKQNVIVSSIETSLQNLTFKKKEIMDPIKIRKSQKPGLLQLLKEFENLGYQSVYQVEEKGTFARRGGLIDIFPSTEFYPVRIEFYGDKVDSIRQFSVAGQKSFRRIDEVTIRTTREFRLTDKIRSSAGQFLRKDIEDEEIKEDLARLSEGIIFDGYEKYFPWLIDEEVCLLDLLPRNSLLIIDEPEKIYTRLEEISRLIMRTKFLSKSLQKFKSIPYYQNKEALKKSDLTTVNLILMRGVMERKLIEYKTLPFELDSNKPGNLIKLLKKTSKKSGLVLNSEDKGRLDRLKELLHEWELPLAKPRQKITKPSNIFLSQTKLCSSFHLADPPLMILSDEDIFGKRAPRRVNKQASFSQEQVKRLPFTPGDYVVHEDYGLALFEEVCQELVDGFQRDYLYLRFAGQDRLYLPVEQMEKLTRYIGADQSRPKLNRLGSNQWPNLKRKARSSVKKMAIDLLKLYAKRLQIKGYSFAKDSPWQAELEDSFPYKETPDQKRAITEVKGDMEKAKPMDRLVCGDVGYGKTEVALRAAFKAAYDGKQVMILAPTTILAQQHFQTFSQRLKPFPVEIDVLSRFRTRKEQRIIVEKLNQGRIDIIIGTHRLLQKDVKPKNLGLLVIDEEQRFGVNHKELLRNMRESIDVITMTATPIPRTLQMSLSGIRDISIINTPPEERQPVQTYVGRYRNDIARSAIHREIERGGQVYYLYNKVQSIENAVRRVKKLAPGAAVGLAHGQMPEHRLEKSMLSFLNKEVNVLVCTTIIESGIDIPIANTIIVDGAERFGLAQLYQLRGRVGRSNHRAYSYFFYNSPVILTTNATERLTTIGELTELSSGLKIALKDLEIRGAGNLLGSEQHGNIASVGFDLYCKLLKEEVENLKGEPILVKGEAQLDLPVNLHIPEDYITQTELRLEIYQNISLVQSSQDIKNLEIELKDRFGPIPPNLNNLIQVGYLRNLAQKAGLDKISWRRNKLILSPFKINLLQEIDLQNHFYKYRRDDNSLILEINFNRRNLLFLTKIINDIIQKLIYR